MSKKSKQGYAPSLPLFPPRRYSYKNHHDNVYPSFTLPFVRFPKSPRDKQPVRLWSVPRVDDYCVAVRIGREYAAHVIQLLKDNPQDANENYLGHIAADIDFEDKTETKGYWIGFFTHLGQHIAANAKSIDPFKELDDFLAIDDKILAESDDEEES